ncbi:MAG: hypothetical protein NTX75_02405 [Proteobacteria bacterium]|nr:hypothetical protein [Pseudomonadota bacterium]
MINVHNILPEDVEQIIGEPLPNFLQNRCRTALLQYQSLTPEERDGYILNVVRDLLHLDMPSAGKDRLSDWERGWQENLDLVMRDPKRLALIPKYYGKHTFSRWKQQIIRPISQNFDYHILALFVDWALYSYGRNAKAIYEFGCGPAYHLLRARVINSTARLIGLDWTNTSQNIIQCVADAGIETNIEGRQFNFFEPDESLEVQLGSCIYTVAALEQLGDQFEPFLQFLIRKRPDICLHFEPIEELLDIHSLIDGLSILYFRKRNYLYGFLTRLRELEAQGSITIIRQQRIYTGSYYIEGHSLVVWKPNK